MLRAEVGDPDGTRSPVRQHVLSSLVGGDRPVEVARHRVMEEEEVDVIDAEPS